MRSAIEVDSATEIESQHKKARAKLEAANARFERALAESQRLKRSGATLVAAADEELIGEALVAAREAAELVYRTSLAALKTDSSDAARWRCARALIELDRLSASSTRRVR